MKSTALIATITITFSALVFASIEYTVAQENDVTLSQCLMVVKEAIAREGIKQLSAKDQLRVNERCEQGDIIGAIESVKQIGAVKRCMLALNTHWKKNTGSKSKDARKDALGHCRRGNLEAAMAAVNPTLTSKPELPAQIVSFKANTLSVKKGDSVTVSWQTKNANMVMLGRKGKQDIVKVATSGTQTFSPIETTTYLLMVGTSTNGPTAMKSKSLKVTVRKAPAGTCSIKGKLMGEISQTIQERMNGPGYSVTVAVGITMVGNNIDIDSALVNKQGKYRFNKLIAGNDYIIQPHWKSNPMSRTISCIAGKTHIVPIITITGRPLYD